MPVVMGRGGPNIYCTPHRETEEVVIPAWTGTCLAAAGDSVAKCTSVFSSLKLCRPQRICNMHGTFCISEELSGLRYVASFPSIVPLFPTIHSHLQCCLIKPTCCGLS